MNKVFQKSRQSGLVIVICLYQNYIKNLMYIIYQVWLKQAHSKRNFSELGKTENMWIELLKLIRS